MSDPAKDKKKWGGFGKMLHRDRPESTSLSTQDSAYGSEPSRDSYNSSAPSMTNSDHSDIKPTSSVNDKGEPVSTRQVVNSDGQVVTTTTTTTTTTTSTGQGGNASASTSGPHTSDLANKLDPRVDSNARNDGSPPGPGGSAPNIPQRSGLRHGEPSSQSAQASAAPSIYDVRDGRQADDSARHNYSYPNRSGQSGNSGQGTMGGIKAAAAGIHGAGETLRGTLNSTVDRYGGAPPEKVAAHNQVSATGRQEIDSGRLAHQHAPSRHQQQPQQAYQPPPQTGYQTGATETGRSSGPLKGILKKS